MAGDAVTRRRLGAAALALAATAVLYLPLCDLAFDCGCTWPLLGGDSHCNVRQPRPPHCPLCAGPWIYGLAFGLVLWGALFVPLDRALGGMAVRPSAAGRRG